MLKENFNDRQSIGLVFAAYRLGFVLAFNYQYWPERCRRHMAVLGPMRSWALNVSDRKTLL